MPKGAKKTLKIIPYPAALPIWPIYGRRNPSESPLPQRRGGGGGGGGGDKVKMAWIPRLFLHDASLVIGTVLHTSLVAHLARACPSYHSMKRLGVLLLPLDGMHVHCRVIPKNTSNNKISAPSTFLLSLVT